MMDDVKIQVDKAEIRVNIINAKWIIGPGINPTCSSCKSEVPAILFNGKWSHKFCPNCGAYMVGEKDNE